MTVEATPISGSPFRLITLDTLRTLFGFASAATGDNAKLEIMIDQVTELIQTLCNRTFETATHTEYYDGSDADEIVLDNLPIDSITSIHSDKERLFGDTTVVDPLTYTFYENGIIKLLPGYGIFREGAKNIKVIYVAGYSTDNIPKDLEMIAAETIMKKFKSYKSGTIGQTVIASGGVNTTFSKDDVSPENKEILFSKYRI